ncbi:ABC transporter substrate-binding protein, partial [Herbaspirillum sp. RU 5E]|nr:ABC transporter substrate-binding protein [Herbaspirillum sp. RU 5E]
TLAKTFKEQALPANLIGSGPFVFKSQIPNKEVVLARRDDYNWPAPGVPNPGRAYLERIVIHEIVEEGLRTGALESGQVDIAKGIQPSDEQP